MRSDSKWINIGGFPFNESLKLPLQLGKGKFINEWSKLKPWEVFFIYEKLRFVQQPVILDSGKINIATFNNLRQEEHQVFMEILAKEKPQKSLKKLFEYFIEKAQYK